MQERFIRLAARAVGGVKIASRHTVNPALPEKESFDTRRFGELLRARFGAPDGLGGDTEYSYALEDRETRVRFRAYAAQSGPAYGGSPVECFVEVDVDHRLTATVARTLHDFEAWLMTRPEDHRR